MPIDKSSQPGIVIYFAEESDTLWDIAKRYHTTTAEIAQVNKIDEDEQLKNREFRQTASRGGGASKPRGGKAS